MFKLIRRKPPTVDLSIAEFKVVLAWYAENEQLKATTERLREEGQTVLALAQECATLVPALRRSMEMTATAHRDLQQIEARYGITRPSLTTAPDTRIDFEQLWNVALADPA